MTNVVKKGANRASAAKKTSKAAQRTPLPPRGKAGVAGKGVSAKVIKEEVDKKAAKRANTPARRLAREAEEAMGVRKPRKAADKPVSPTRRTRKSATATPAKTEAPAVSAVEPSWPGASKGQAFIDYAAPHNWTSAVAYPNKTNYVITTSKGAESIVIKFFDGKQDYAPENLPTWYSNGRSVSLRNVGGARGHVDGSRPVKRDLPARAARKSGAARPDDDKPRTLDIDLMAMPEADVLAFLAGKTITWKVHNEGKDTDYQEDRLKPFVYCSGCGASKEDDSKLSPCCDMKWKRQAAWKVEDHPRKTGLRILHFRSAISMQYRAVDLSRIVDVS